MSKRDDINELYLPSQKHEKICKITFWLNCIVSLLNILFHDWFVSFLTTLQIVLSTAFVIISVLDDSLYWYNAESERRKNNIQTAFNIRLSEFETAGYYNNSLLPSITKYALNNFENCFFSKNISKKMLCASSLKTLFAIILFIIVSCMIPNVNILLIAIQSIFSAYILEDTILLTIYTLRMNKLFDSFYTMFVTNGIHQREQLPILLSYCVEYESIKAHYKVRLDSKIFENMNSMLSEKWKIINSKVNIKYNERM